MKKFIQTYNETYLGDKFKDDYGIVFNVNDVPKDDESIINDKLTEGKSLRFAAIVKGN